MTATLERMAPAEFPVTVDRESYVIPTIGIAALAGTGAAIVASIVGIAIGGSPLPSGQIGEALEIPVLFAWITFAGSSAAAVWIRRRWRIHHERKLVIDPVGIAYVRFAGQSRMIRWPDILEATEDEEWELGRWLTITHRSGRFVIEAHAFHGYEEIRELLRTYLPGRVTLLPRR